MAYDDRTPLLVNQGSSSPRMVPAPLPAPPPAPAPPPLTIDTHLADLVYQVFHLVTQVGDPRSHTYLSSCRRALGCPVSRDSLDEAERGMLGTTTGNSNRFKRGAPLAQTNSGLAAVYSFTGLAIVVGGLAGYLYVLPSSAAAAYITGIRSFQALKAGLGPLLQYCGPIANALLNIELMVSITSEWARKKTPAEVGLDGQIDRCCQWVLGGVSFVWAISAISPLAYMGSKESKDRTDEALDLVGAACSIPSFYVGARSAINYLSTKPSPFCSSSNEIKKLRALFIGHMNAELQVFIKLPTISAGDRLSKNDKINGLEDFMWPSLDGVGNAETVDMSTILPQLLTIGQQTTTLAKHTLKANNGTFFFTFILIIFRIMSLFGFTKEAFDAGIAMSGKGTDDKGALVLGMVSAILTACAQAGLSIKSIETIGKAAGEVLQNCKKDASIDADKEAKKNPIAYIVAFCVAYIIGCFSGGTGAVAAHDTLNFPPAWQGLFESVSFVMSGVAVNGYFCFRLFQRMLNAYSKTYAQKEERRITLFISAYRNIVAKLESMDTSQFKELVGTDTMRPTIKKLLRTYPLPTAQQNRARSVAIFADLVEVVISA